MRKTGPIPLPLVIAGIYALCLILEALIFGPYLWNPNNYVFAFGGDALVIYYDMVYHICHGQGILFEGMNHPYGESMFMTDANASFTILLSYLNQWFSLCHYVPGILHGLIFFLLPLTSIYLFLILRKIGVSFHSSLIFGILITFLSPQILRILGHFGLAFPFVIPMAIYWVLNRYDSIKPRITDIFYLTVLIFFTLNNPYLGFAASAMVMIAGIIRFLKYRVNGMYIFLMGFLPSLISFIVIEYTDPFEDRIQMQWGFFYYFTSIQGILYPNGSLLHELLSVVMKIPDVRFEGRVNLGIVTSLALITVSATYMFHKIFKKHHTFPGVPTTLRPLLWAGFILFIYAANNSLYGFAKPFLEEFLGTLLMFKASGRMAWPFYYICTIAAAFYCDRLWNTSSRIGKPLYLAAIVLWGLEAYNMNTHRFRDIHHANPFIETDLRSQANTLNIDTSVYQGTYMIPVTQSWNDKFLFPVHFQTQYSGMLLSAITGVPMINAMLSRAPVTTSATSIQLAAEPYIHRERIKDLDLSKPILLVVGDKHPPPTPGEQYLIDSSEYIGDFAKSSVYSLDLEKIRIPKYSEEKKNILIAEDFDPKGNPRFGFNDNFCKQTTPEDNLIWQGRFSSTIEADSLDIILWYYLFPASYHNPQISVSTGTSTYNFYDRSSRNIQDNWVRQSISIPYSNTLEIRALGERVFVFDSLTIKSY